MDILENFLFQLLSTVGIVIIFGFLIALCRRAFCKITGNKGIKILLATGIIGTPIHELSHALMCLIFGHKITEMKLYDPNSDDGTLGYVNHSFNPKNIYHQIGNFFIGIAPILGGSGILLLLSLILVPDVNAGIMREFRLVGSVDVSRFFEAFGSMIGYVFDFDNMTDISWWIFIILAFSIASHMELSAADIKGSLYGLGLLAAILLLADTVLYFIAERTLINFTSILVSLSLSISVFLMLSIIFLLAMILIALLVKGIQRLTQK